MRNKVLDIIFQIAATSQLIILENKYFCTFYVQQKSEK